MDGPPAPAARRSPWPSAGRCPSCGPAGRRSSSARVAHGRRADAHRAARGASAARRAPDAGPRLPRRVPAHRAALHRATACGTARSSGVVSTNALELGVDIGRLDVAVLAGYPGSIAATWQQIGRAGRRQDVSVAVLVASAAPGGPVRDPPPGVPARGPARGGPRLDPDNLHVLLAHLRAATFELPFEPGEMLRAWPGRRPARVPRRERARPPGRTTAAGTGARRTSRPRRSRCAPRLRRTS